MREQLAGNLAMPIGGLVPGSTVSHKDNLYWLDENGCVLALRATQSTLTVGARFFEALHTATAERQALYRTLACGKQGLYLMQCGAAPVLILRYPYAADRTLLALIPDEPLFTALRTPAAYFADASLMCEVELSPLSASRHMPFDTQTYEALTEWLLPYLRLCVKEGQRTTKPIDLLQWLQLRTARIANAVGFDVQYDFGGIGFATVCDVLYVQLFVNILALLLAARRAAKQDSLYLGIVRESCAAPRLYARMQLHEPVIPHEIGAACQALTVRSIPHRVWLDASRPGVLHAELGFCGAPLVQQGVRNPFDLLE